MHIYTLELKTLVLCTCTSIVPCCLESANKCEVVFIKENMELIFFILPPFLILDAFWYNCSKMDALLIKENLEAFISEMIFCLYLFIYFADQSGLLLHLPPLMG